MSVTTQSNAWSVWVGAETDCAQLLQAEDDLLPASWRDLDQDLSRLATRRTRRFGKLSTAALSAMVLAVVFASSLVRSPSSAVSRQPARTTTPGAPGLVVIPPQNFDLPDPMLVADHGQYYAYFSTAFLDKTHANVPELVGAPGRWGPEVDAMPRLPVWAVDARHGGKVWAPYVRRIDGHWLMYFSAVVKRPGRIFHCLGVATARSAAGPFEPVGTTPLECQLDQGGDIDVQPFTDPSGPGGVRHPWYILWKSDNNSLTPIQPTLIWSAPLADDGLTVSGAPRVIFAPDVAWQLPVLEAPQMVHSPLGGDWLFYSAGRGFFTGAYAIGVARCDGPLGLCHDLGEAPLVSTNQQGEGPGEETVFIAPDHSYWLLYNPWHTGLLAALLRPAEGVRIGWSVQGPYVADAGVFPAPAAHGGNTRPAGAPPHSSFR